MVETIFFRNTGNKNTDCNVHTQYTIAVVKPSFTCSDTVSATDLLDTSGFIQKSRFVDCRETMALVVYHSPDTTFYYKIVN